jgi:D-glycero-alpha-D-manno-heptose-7-phosphate kinase
LGGGGTDLPSFYSNHGGFVVTCGIDKYVYVVTKRRFEEEIRLSYSITEIVDSIDKLKHPVVREALRLLCLRSNIEIVSIADMPAETGLGSSGSFTIGLLHALHAFKDENISRNELAEEACALEMDILKEPSGKQDPYIAVFGGFKCLDISKDGKVTVSTLKIPDDTIHELQNNLVFFYTGLKRSSAFVLHDQNSAIKVEESAALDSMQHIKDIGYRVKRALEQGDLSEFGRLQNEHWLAKKSTSSKISSKPIDRYYDLGIKNGAFGGKLVGAGGGGFLMFYCENGKNKLRKAMACEGLKEVRFGFEREGSKIIINL